MIPTINYVTGAPREFQPRSTAFKDIKRRCLTIEERLSYLAKIYTPHKLPEPASEEEKANMKGRLGGLYKLIYGEHGEESKANLEMYRQTGEITAEGIPLKFAYTGPLTGYNIESDKTTIDGGIMEAGISFKSAIDDMLKQGREWVEKEGKTPIGDILQWAKENGKCIRDAILLRAKEEGTYFPVSFLNPWRRDRPIHHIECGSKILIYADGELKGEAFLASVRYGTGREGDYSEGIVELKIGNVQKRLEYGTNMCSSPMDFMYFTLDVAVRQILLGVSTTNSRTPKEHLGIIPTNPGDEAVIPVIPSYERIRSHPKFRQRSGWQILQN